MQLTISEEDYNYDISGLDVDEHEPSDPPSAHDSVWEKVTHPNQDYVRAHKEHSTPLGLLRR